jgi:Acyl-CoA reductase (LuxC)
MAAVTVYGHDRPFEVNDLIRMVNEAASHAGEPFSAVRREVIEQLSKILLVRRDVAQFSALGFWLRTSATRRLEERFFFGIPKDYLAIPRGLAFHLPPGNVDTLFVYSWALSFLAGNTNVVRLPTTQSRDISWLVHQVVKLLSGYQEANRQIFCSYDYQSSLNREISRLSDVRVIWGGDAKVMQVSEDPVRPDGVSIGFPDRKSLAAISTPVYLSSDEKCRGTLSEKFFNDVFWFDQMGCGSPRVVAWIGDEADSVKASNDFYTRVASIAIQKGYRIDDGTALAKFSLVNELVAAGGARRSRNYGGILTVFDLDPGFLRPPGNYAGGGSLGHVVLSSLEDLGSLINRSTQTIAHHGFDLSSLRELAKWLGGRGGYRFVPIGQALDFDSTWDGVPLLEYLTRRVSVRA